MADNLLRTPPDDMLKRGQELCREMFTVLREHGLLPENEQDEVRYALSLLCLSSFYGTVPFSHFVRRIALIWSVWEDNSVTPKDVQNELMLSDFLRQWTPEKRTKPL